MERYSFVTLKDSKELHLICDEFIKMVQKDLKNYFTFDIKLIGSGEKRLITYDNVNNNFDLDYNLVIQRDKEGLFNNPKMIKDIFRESFNKFCSMYNFRSGSNSTSVLTFDHIEGNFTFDVAILIQSNSGNYLKIIYDKYNDRYIWNEINYSDNIDKKFKFIKKQGYFNYFKDLYLKKKNNKRNISINKTSYSIFLECIKETLDIIGK